MPDALRQTISATEMPALFGVSPYATPWMLYQRIANGVAIDDIENNRMSWGTRMQPLLLQAAAEDLRLEVRPNPVGADGKDIYLRRAGLPIGCTRDGEIICPDRGPGAIETKCVFDYRVWMEKWGGGKQPPKHYEIQLQHQMLVGDGEKPFTWGTLAVWICGQMEYFEREPIPELWDAIERETQAFFARVKAGDAPEPFGVPIEAPLLTRLFPPVPESVLDLREDPDHVSTSDAVAMYKHLRETEAGAKRAREEIQAKLTAIAESNERVLLPCGVNYRRKKSGKGYTIDAFVPDSPGAAPVREPVLAAG